MDGAIQVISTVGQRAAAIGLGLVIIVRLLLGATIAAIGLIVLYFLMKKAIKTAIKECDDEKELRQRATRQGT